MVDLDQEGLFGLACPSRFSFGPHFQWFTHREEIIAQLSQLQKKRGV
jgi:hypothetical protein